MAGREGRLGWWCDEALWKPSGGLPVCVRAPSTRTVLPSSSSPQPRLVQDIRDAQRLVEERARTRRLGEVVLAHSHVGMVQSPADCSSEWMVGWAIGWSLHKLQATPAWSHSRPLARHARDGARTGAGTQARVKRVPLRCRADKGGPARGASLPAMAVSV